MSSRAFMEELCNNAGGYSRLVNDTLRLGFNPTYARTK